jgi:hypothetical protein
MTPTHRVVSTKARGDLALTAGTEIDCALGYVVEQRVLQQVVQLGRDAELW